MTYLIKFDVINLCRKQWQRLCVMKLFIEHVIVDHEAELLMFATRLDKVIIIAYFIEIIINVLVFR